MRKALLYVGGEIFPEGIFPHPEEDTLTVAADSGYRTARLLGVSPQILLGDFDSLTELPLTAEIVRYPAHKDYTDGQLALALAMERGAQHITIIGGLGGRVDHTLSCLAMLETVFENGLEGCVCNGKNEVRYLRGPAKAVIEADLRYPYLSLIALDETLAGVTLAGCEYPLQRATVFRREQFAISNRITAKEATVRIEQGAAYLIRSAD